MPNTALITKRDLINLDKKVYTPQDVELKGRKYFSSIMCAPYDEYYAYDVVESTGKARRSVARNTNTPVGDEKKNRFFTGMTKFEYALEYTDDQVGRANQIGDTDFVPRKGLRAARAMAEYEDKVIFNGESDDNIIGLTESIAKTGFQEAKPTDTLDKMDNEAILKYFKEASHLITDLGYSAQKPILLLTNAAESILDTPFNEYNANTTVEDMISKYFSTIDTCQELESKFTKRSADMGLIFLNDQDTCGIPDAQPVHRSSMDHIRDRTTIVYKEVFGGVAVRYQTHFVQLPGLAK